MGEPAGVGGEIAAKAWHLLRHTGPAFFLIDDADRLSGAPIRRIEAPEQANAVFAEALPVLHRPLPKASIPGQLDPANAPAVIAAIDEAVALAKAGRASGIVTNPIQKSALYAAGFAHPGHTEYLAEIAGTGVPPVMLLACPELRVVPVTIHEPLKQAIARLTRRAHRRMRPRSPPPALRQDFGIAAPRLAIAGLNPHAGEDGTIGTEDRDIVAPAVAALRPRASTPRPDPADTMFTAKARPGYDVALGLYHDQALIPIKTLDMTGGVNVTLGLSIVRTCPDHGTALDIAGQGLADPGSLIAAIRLAAEIAAHRQNGHPMTAAPKARRSGSAGSCRDIRCASP